MIAEAGDERITQALAGIRETFEELGILLAYDQAGQPVPPAQVQQLDRKASLYEQCRARGWTLAVDQLWYLAHWTAPLDLPKRFNVPFLWPACPRARRRWPTRPSSSSPPGSLRRMRLRALKKKLFILFPTQRTLQRIAHLPDTQAVIHTLLGEKPLWRACPVAAT
jgi:8-oxo-dGTP pyrophosphatase MutT (NUDIX family)